MIKILIAFSIGLLITLTFHSMDLFTLLVFFAPVVLAVILGLYCRIRADIDEGKELCQWAKRNAHFYRNYKTKRIKCD